MGLESGTYVTDLVTTNPASGDTKSAGDDHLRLVKTVLKNSFPNSDRAHYFWRAISKTANYTILSTDQNKLIVADATSGAFNLTLPTLGTSNDGWGVTVVKSDASANVVTVVGTISGETNFSLPKRYGVAHFIWTGTAWIGFMGVRVSSGVPTVSSLAVEGALTVGTTLVATGASTLTGIVTQESTSHEVLPSGTTGQRPAGAGGNFRYNSTTGLVEWYDGVASTWRQPALVAPLTGAYKGLTIHASANTSVTVSADALVVNDGTTARQATAFSAVINMGTTGINALDTGVIASSTWYFIWVVMNAAGTVGAIASLSSTAPTMPGGYTFKARVGAVRTAAAIASLMGTYQRNAVAVYLLGVAQTTARFLLLSGASGSIATPTWTEVGVTGGAVPTTAFEIELGLHCPGAAIMAAPSAAYGAYNSTTIPPPLMYNNATGSISGRLVLESGSVFCASQAGSSLFCNGWTDNI